MRNTNQTLQLIEENKEKAKFLKKEYQKKTYHSIMFAIDYAINELGDNSIHNDKIYLIEYLVSQQKKYYVRMKDEDAEIRNIDSAKSIANRICNLLNLPNNVTIDELYEMYELSGRPKINPFNVMKQIDSMWKISCQ